MRVNWIRLGLLSLAIVCACLSPAMVAAQDEESDVLLSDLERELDATRRQLQRLQREFSQLRTTVEESIDTLPEGFLTDSNEEFRLGGKFEIFFLDIENLTFAPLGDLGRTFEPDPHFEVHRFRLEPEIKLSRHIKLRAQLDFHPTDGDTELREATAVHQVEPAWWFQSRFILGLEDRFAQPDRRTKSHPLIDTAFFRRETAGAFWKITLGNAYGPPEVAGAAAGGGGGSAVGDGEGDVLGAASLQNPPFDFAQNLGELELYLSIAQGFRLDNEEVNFDNAAFNHIISDDRELEDDLSLRELGVGLGYQRSFSYLGEVHALGYLYNDELRDESIDFLTQELTVRDPGGVPIAGYGDSRSRTSWRYGARVEYFLPAAAVIGHFKQTDPNDGLRLLGQWVEARDGDLDRYGWFVQASWLYSFDRSLLFDRYFRSVEPIVRYGKLNAEIAPVPVLPGTWDRTEFLVGAIVQVAGDTYVQFEYTMYEAETGIGKVKPSEFLVLFLFTF